jgi:two-component system LytT family response regulator
MTAQTPRLQAFVIDDEPLAIKRLVRLLQATGRVDVIGTATDPVQGVAGLASTAANVVFLDVQMPGLTGFEVVERLSDRVSVVFTTAYDRHAVQAFEPSAVDYLLKPIEPARLGRTLERLERRAAEPAAPELRSVVERVVRELRAPAFLEQLASRTGDRVRLVPVSQVTHVAARDRATYAVTPAGEHLLDATIVELERRLDPARFLRIHRGTLLNLAWVSELHADFGGRLTVRLRDDRRTELVVSRDRVRTLKERLGVS